MTLSAMFGLASIEPILELTQLMQAIESLWQTRFNYCCPLWSGVSEGEYGSGYYPQLGSMSRVARALLTC